MTLGVEVAYGTRHPWAPPARLIVAWAQAAAGRRASRAQLAIRIVTPAESQHLNREFRGQNRPTNVLSFPAAATAAGDEAAMLGDLAICARIVAREASAQGKTLAAHWAHMVVHGVLHLVGYDHLRREDARRMERRERTLLKKLGFPNPYVMPDHG
ncbi:MAG TPA: rRNA maturation RNase YbeY [Steroidobacteraceae bacterium]|nr:rRNA maturation RNase YbeY [Steroidobacteraceae bacterium]